MGCFAICVLGKHRALMFTTMCFILSVWAGIKALIAIVEGRSPSVSIACAAVFLVGAVVM